MIDAHWAWGPTTGRPPTDAVHADRRIGVEPPRPRWPFIRAADPSGVSGVSPLTAPEGRQPRSGRPAPWRILIVDDEEDAFAVATSLLHSLDRGVQTVWERDVAGAIVAMRAGTFDACLVDLALQGEDGLELIRQATDTASEVALIVLSGRIGASLSRQAIDAGATDFLDKGDLSARDLERSIRLGIARTQAVVRQRESEALYRSVVAALAEGIVVHGQDGAITTSNDAAERILGLSKGELVGRSSLSVYGPPTRDDGTPIVVGDDPASVTLRTGEPRHEVLMSVAVRGGLVRWLTINTQPVWRAGRDAPTAVVASFTDVTEKRELEEHLRQAAKMEAIGRLAGGVAHDFNNLLSAISGYGELLVTDGSLGGASREHVEEIRRAAGRAASLTRQLLAFSRRQVLRPELIDIDEVVAEMESMVRRLIPEAIGLDVGLGAAGATVHADRVQVEQVILNLSANARDAMPDGGRLSITTSLTNLDALHRPDETTIRPGRYVQITVTDDGEGMDEATRLRAFEPFFTTKAPGHGTGLGLASVYGTVKQSDGYVWVYSEPGEGTVVKVYFPVVEGAAVTDGRLPRPTGAWVARPGEVILLAEDEPAVRGLVTRILERAGYQVLIAVDGLSAIHLGRSIDGRVDCLISDVMMPGIQGPEVVRRLRETRPTLPAVLMSGYTEDGIDLERSMLAGVGFIQKPFASDDLLEAVRRSIDGAQQA